MIFQSFSNSWMLWFISFRQKLVQMIKLFRRCLLPCPNAINQNCAQKLVLVFVNRSLHCPVAGWWQARTKSLLGQGCETLKNPFVLYLWVFLCWLILSPILARTVVVCLGWNEALASLMNLSFSSPLTGGVMQLHSRTRCIEEAKTSLFIFENEITWMFCNPNCGFCLCKSCLGTDL